MAYRKFSTHLGPIVTEESRRQEHISAPILALLLEPKPVIYVSFGATAILSRQQIDLIVDAFAHDDWNIVWALPQEQQVSSLILETERLFRGYIHQPRIRARCQLRG